MTARARALGLAALAFAACAAPAGAATAGAPVLASPLAANGFASPACTSAALSAQLSPAERTNCSVSGVAIAPVPLSNYAVDINIPSGLDASFQEDVYSVVQDLFLTPVWTAVVWLVHVVLIALEWCYSIDLLGPSTLARAGAALGGARRIFTDPWLGLALALAAVGFAWQGLVRRRVLDTLGQAGLVAVMVVSGLWIIADPAGTVGAIGGMADQAALATVAASATGNPSQPVASVDQAFGTVFSSAISGPWCYLEFGDVDWCRQPAALDPRLHAVATRLQALYRSEANCHAPPVGLIQCAPAGSALQSQLAGAVTALGEAQTNGELFLALPPGALSRTALSAQTVTPTLYGTLCGSSNPTACTAATAPQAEFRTAAGTWPRVGGLLLIVAGTLGMLLLLGFLALRLLGAALAALLYLMLAPLAVLAPALGESGRQAFRVWLVRLLGAAIAKLVYSVALGVVLLISALLASLTSLGWWTQWLLVSVFWWMAFEQRHRVLSLVLHERSEPARRAPFATRAWLAARAVGGTAGAARAGGRGAVIAGTRVVELVKRHREFPRGGGSVPPPPRDASRVALGAERLARRERRLRARGELDAQAERVRRSRVSATGQRGEPVGGHGAAHLRADAAAASLRARRARIAGALRSARERGDARRVASLELRGRALDAALAAARPGPVAAPAALARGLGRLGLAAPARALERRSIARELDRAARAPASRQGADDRAAGAPASRQGGDEQAARLAALAGLSPSQYLRQPPAARRRARLEIERELARRRELLGELRGRTPPVAPYGREDPGAAAPRARRLRQFGWRAQ